jgi:hypothetical protein
MKRLLAAAVLLALAPAAAQGQGRWRPIFNGRNLDGWIPKINHHPAGENWRDTFQVKHGVLRVDYSRYPSFKDEFGHLIYNRPLSSYRLRLEYRFMGPSPSGAQPWAWRNSGVMFHGQAPAAMALDQPYPIAVEAQLLGGDAPGEVRPTGNVCTPGTTVSIGGIAQTAHCISSSAPTFQDGEWVRFELEVHGGRLVRQYVNGKKVIEYTDIRLDPSEFRRFADIDPGAARPGPLTSGYISLQAESGPIEFRKIELMELPG